MKNFFKTQNNVTPITVISAIFIVLCAISLYYMQYDLTATNWIYVAIYGTLTVSSLAAMLYFVYSSDKDKVLFSVGLVAINTINLIGSLIFAITKTNYFTIISAAATAVYAVFALNYVDLLSIRKSLNSNIAYNIAVPVLFVIPAIVAFVLKSQTNNMLAIMYGEAIILFVAGIIMSLVAIIKGNKRSFIVIYGLFCLVMFTSNLLNVLGTSVMQNLLHGSSCLLLSFLIPSLMSDKE